MLGRNWEGELSTLEPKQARSLATRRRLLDAAVDTLLEEGYTGLSAATIARRAGVSRGAYQHHFPNRQSLLIEALRYLADSERHGLPDQIAKLAEGEPRILGGLDLVYELYRGKLFSTILELALASGRDPELKSAIQEEERSQSLVIYGIGTQVFGSEAAAGPGFALQWRNAIAVIRGLAMLTFLGHPKSVVDRQWAFTRQHILDHLLVEIER